MDGEDPLAGIAPLLRRGLRDDALLEGLARLYRHVGDGRRAALRAALPGIAEEVALRQALRAPERRN
jgi:hypothetical protein